MADYSPLVQQAIDKDRAERGLPPLARPLPPVEATGAALSPDAANAVDAAIATPVGDQQLGAIADAAIATPVGAQVDDNMAAAPVAADLASEVAASNQPVPAPPPAAQPPVAFAGHVLTPGQVVTPGAPVAAPATPAPATVATEAPAQTEVAAATTTESDAATTAPEPTPAPLTLAPNITDVQRDLATIERESTAAGERLAAAEEESAKEKSEASRKFLEDFDAEVSKGMSEIDVARAGLKKNQEELSAINNEVAALPPIRDTRSGIEKAAGALTLAIGGMQDQNNLVAGLMQGMNVQTNNANQAADRIDKAIARDIDLQKANYDKARDNQSAKLTEYGIARQYLGDSQQSLRLATAIRGERFAAEMERQAANLQSKTARDRGVMASSALRMQYLKETNDLLQTEMGTRGMAFQAIALGKMTPEQAAAFISSGRGGDPNAPTPAEVKSAKARSDVNKSQEQLATGYHPAGAKLALGLYVGDAEVWNRKKPEDKQKELKTDFQSRELIRQMGDVRTYIAENPDYALDRKKRATIDSKRAAILSTYREAKELGALDNGVERVVARAIGDPTGWEDTVISAVGGQPGAIATLDAQIDAADASVRSRRENNGLASAAPPESAPAASPKQSKAAPAKPVVKRRDASAELDALK